MEVMGDKDNGFFKLIFFVRACFEVRECRLPILGFTLAGNEDALPPPGERRSHHALVVSVLVAARSVEIVDAKVNGL